MSLLLVSGLLFGFVLCLIQRLRDWYRWTVCASNKYVKEGAIAVLVLGDMGRSPRMCNHVTQIARALQANEIPQVKRVYLIGYQMTGLPRALETHPNVVVKALPQIAYGGKSASRFKLALHSLLRLLYNVVNVWLTLCKIDQLQTVIMQSPPSHATAAVVSLLCYLRSASFIIDCHNYGWTIAALNPAYERIVPLLQLVETFGLRRAHSLFCVSKNMKRDLETKVAAKVVTLYDKPPAHFREPSDEMRQTMLERYLGINPTTHRGFILVTSTSYSIDEDLNPFVEALRIFANDPRAPSLIRLMVTGKGDMERDFAELVKSARAADEAFAEKVVVHQVFASVEDYPMLLGSADLGVCLHQSSSQLDLPMKVVDMIGVRLPFLAFHYSTIDELVAAGGATFRTAEELGALLCEVADEASGKLKAMKESLRGDLGCSWQEEWERKALPVVKTWSCANRWSLSAKDKLH